MATSTRALTGLAIAMSEVESEDARLGWRMRSPVNGASRAFTDALQDDEESKGAVLGDGPRWWLLWGAAASFFLTFCSLGWLRLTEE